MSAILDRDGACCVWCARPLGIRLVDATTEHVVPRLKGGPSWLENEVAACRRCNGQRGHQSLAEWAQECQRRGWDVAIDTLCRVLDSLVVAVDERGGQRRARRYAEAQLRRLRRL